MNQGCHGATVEMQGTSSISHCVETGFVVSGVEATSIRSILSWTIKSFATWAARLGFDWLSLTTTSTGPVALPSLTPALAASLKFATMNPCEHDPGHEASSLKNSARRPGLG